MRFIGDINIDVLVGDMGLQDMKGLDVFFYINYISEQVEVLDMQTEKNIQRLRAT